MSALLLRFAGPMQSWGTQSRFDERDAGTEPSKSGVVGLLCASLGRVRDAPVDDLAALRMGVRVDFEGVVQRDFQTSGGVHRVHETYGVARSSGGVSGEAVVSRRYFIADADFLVALEGSADLLEELGGALLEPRWPLCLGRKAFVPGVPVWMPGGLRPDMDLRQALTAEPWPRSGLGLPRDRPTALRLVMEGIGAEIRIDQPVGSAFRTRRFAPRAVGTSFLRLGEDVPIRED